MNNGYFLSHLFHLSNRGRQGRHPLYRKDHEYIDEKGMRAVFYEPESAFLHNGMKPCTGEPEFSGSDLWAGVKEVVDLAAYVADGEILLENVTL